MGMKKSILFTTDALIAAIIIVSAIIIFSNLYIEENKITHLGFLSNDMLGVMSELKISEVNNSYISYLIAQGEITDLNKTIIEQIGEFWALNKTEYAQNLVINISSGLLPKNLGYSFVVGNEDIYAMNYTKKRELIAARKMISGYEKSKPIKGSTSRAYLKSIKEKKTSSYAYFGGFVGQGNISRQVEHIPNDATIYGSFIELDAGSGFKLYINGNLCGFFVPTDANMTSTRWNISTCNALFLNGIRNNISLNFNNSLENAYIAGGYLRVDYRTKELISNSTPGIAYYYFPGIEGLINLYSSFNIPGILYSIDLYVRFYNNKSTYLTVGNETIFTSGGSSSIQVVNISGYTLPVEPETIPIRLGVGNISETLNVTSGEPSDSILVTDVSGSMSDCGLYSQTQVCRYQCCGFYWFGCWWWYWIQCQYGGSCSGDQCGTCASDITRYHQVVNQSTCIKTKLDLAKEADLMFVDVVLNLSGNRVGLVSYETNLDSEEALTDIKVSLQNEINSYTAGGATCICCGINRAKDMLNASTKKRFMVVMSDGAATMYCSNFNDYTGSGTGGTSDPIDKQWAIDAGQHACSKNITVFAVGFGQDADHETLKQVACNESLYYNASDASNITEIYKRIGEEILVIANYSSQVIYVSGEYPKSVLYPDSYIRFNFTPVVEPPAFGEIELVIETDKFKNCTPSINISEKLRVVQANVLSYSGSHWTSFLEVNGNSVFNISKYGSEYEKIGDPFVLQIQPTSLNRGYNELEIQTADNPSNTTGCSQNNSMVYLAAISSSVSYSEVWPKAEGCAWTIETEESRLINASVPSSYSGNKSCKYTSQNISFDLEDSIDHAVYDLLRNLDFDSNGKINIDIEEQDLEIEALWVSQVPYLWGPSIVEVRVWQ